MKSLSYLIVLSITINLVGCKNQVKVKQDERLFAVTNPGELVFGDKKVTYFIEGQGMPCIVCADGNIQANCLSENLKKIFNLCSPNPDMVLIMMSQRTIQVFQWTPSSMISRFLGRN